MSDMSNYNLDSPVNQPIIQPLIHEDLTTIQPEKPILTKEPGSGTKTTDTVAAASSTESTTTTTATTSPSEPTIDAPPASSTGSTSTTAPNEWFAFSYVGSFMAVMNQVARQSTLTEWLEGQTSRDQTQVQIQLGKDQSKAVKASADTEATQKTTEAMGSFVNAGLSGASALATMKSSARAESEADANMNKKLEPYQNEVTDLNNKKTVLAADADPEDPQVKTAMDKNAKIEEQITVKQEKMRDIRNGRDAEAAALTQKYTAITNSQFEMYKGISTGVTDLLIAGLITKKGAIDAQRQKLDTWEKAMSSYVQNSNSARSSEASNFNSIMDTINQTIKQVYQSFTIKG